MKKIYLVAVSRMQTWEMWIRAGTDDKAQEIGEKLIAKRKPDREMKWSSEVVRSAKDVGQKVEN